jgi:hypothetical protein
MGLLRIDCDDGKWIWETEDVTFGKPIRSHDYPRKSVHSNQKGKQWEHTSQSDFSATIVGEWE